jgi:hypothetical protein
VHNSEGMHEMDSQGAYDEQRLEFVQVELLKMAEVSLVDAFVAMDVILKSGSPRLSLLIPSSLILFPISAFHLVASKH